MTPKPSVRAEIARTLDGLRRSLEGGGIVTPRPIDAVYALAYAAAAVHALGVVRGEQRCDACDFELVAAYTRMATENLEYALAALKDGPVSAGHGPDREDGGGA